MIDVVNGLVTGFLGSLLKTQKITVLHLPLNTLYTDISPEIQLQGGLRDREREREREQS